MNACNSEVKYAISALTTEIMKLTALEGEAHVALSLNIEKAMTRLAVALVAAQSNETSDRGTEEADLPTPEAVLV